jgi:hypothetical protein
MRDQNTSLYSLSGGSVAGSMSEERLSHSHEFSENKTSSQAKPQFNADEKVFSTRSKYVAILENLHKSADYVREQQKALNEIIQQFQIFTGYLEQSDFSKGISTHAWSVYVMHAQVVDGCINRTFQGKPLFNLDNASPLRIHIPVDGEVEAFDLPLPSIRSIIPLGAFLHGVSGRSMPSIGLIEDCMTAITSTLLEIQGARVIISDATRNTRTLRDSKPSTVKLERTRPVFRIEKDLSVAQDIAPKQSFFTRLQGLFAGNRAIA